MERRGWYITLFLLCLLLPAGEVCAKKKISPEDAARVEALYSEGMELLEAGRLDEASERFQSAIEIDDRHAPSYVGVGHVHLNRGDLKGAEKAFKEALRKRKKYAPAFNGLGLVYREKKNELRRAIGFFRDAIRADRAYAEAQYNLAQTYQRFGSSETLGAYKEVLEIDPKHPDALFQIGRIREMGGDYEEAEDAYRKQLDANPGHFGAMVHLGVVLKVQGQTDEAVGVLKRVVAVSNPHQRRALLELAGVYQVRREYDASQKLFDAYIAGLEPEVQAPYYDLGLVAGGRELEQFKAAPPEERKALFEAFWTARDPAPVTEANERLLEHYRRVAFALENFGAYASPWDDRGNAYIRYGDPDHVSRSNDLRLERNPRVLAVKEALISQAAEAGAELLKKRAEFIQQRMDREGGRQRDGDRPRAQVAEASILGWPVYPVDGIWEYWIYVDVGPGIEVTFVQRNYPGPYEYADMPLGTGRIARIWQDMNPEAVVERVAARQPNVYRADFATGPLDFYLYSAAFKGDEGKAALEVYYGIPAGDLAFEAAEGGSRVAHLARGVAVYDEANRLVHRTSRETALRLGAFADTSAGAFIPEVDRLMLPPGNYRVAVQVSDRSSGKSQVYNMKRLLRDYGGEALTLSDIELAASISPAEEGKFLKGDIAVVPMASQAYLQREPVYLYYEIYNLKRDEFGATRYSVSYEVRSLEQKSVGARILGGLGKLLGSREEGGVITIAYEQVGTEPDDRGYLQLDMSTSEPGLQLLRIKVTDENSGQQASKATRFTIR